MDAPIFLGDRSYIQGRVPLDFLTLMLFVVIHSLFRDIYRQMVVCCPIICANLV
jgi:hypothetical protein